VNLIRSLLRDKTALFASGKGEAVRLGGAEKIRFWGITLRTLFLFAIKNPRKIIILEQAIIEYVGRRAEVIT